jgi:uncharacterized protein YdeI (YjbR/CyaY-like superfamily)
VPATADPSFFATPALFRRWLKQHCASARQLWVGYHKVGAMTPNLTWQQSVDQALCFGWIDGVRKNIDRNRYMIRFTPRKPASTWSAVNIKRVNELIEQGLMMPHGLKAFEARKENRSGIYSYEQRSADLPDIYLKRMRANRAAAAFFSAQVPSYRKKVIWWVVSAKQEATRLRRLEQLIADSSNRLLIQQFAAR